MLHNLRRRCSGWAADPHPRPTQARAASIELPKPSQLTEAAVLLPAFAALVDLTKEHALLRQRVEFLQQHLQQRLQAAPAPRRETEREAVSPSVRTSLAAWARNSSRNLSSDRLRHSEI